MQDTPLHPLLEHRSPKKPMNLMQDYSLIPKKTRLRDIKIGDDHCLHRLPLRATRDNDWEKGMMSSMRHCMKKTKMRRYKNSSRSVDRGHYLLREILRLP